HLPDREGPALAGFAAGGAAPRRGFRGWHRRPGWRSGPDQRDCFRGGRETLAGGGPKGQTTRMGKLRFILAAAFSLPLAALCAGPDPALEVMLAAHSINQV